MLLSWSRAFSCEEAFVFLDVESTIRENPRISPEDFATGKCDSARCAVARGLHEGREGPFLHSCCVLSLAIPFCLVSEKTGRSIVCTSVNYFVDRGFLGLICL